MDREASGKSDISFARKRFPELTELELHFFGLKGYGLNYSNPELGRPKFHLVDRQNLASIVFVICEEESPYELKDGGIFFEGNELPFLVNYFGRLNTKQKYFYVRGIEEWIPTLDMGRVLSLNFHPICKGCQFCQRVCEKGPISNVKDNEGFELVMKNIGDSLANINEITINTGLFSKESELANHIFSVVAKAVWHDFSGSIFYIGFQLKTERIVSKILEKLGKVGLSFRYAYTVETFSRRKSLMNNSKGKLDIEEILRVIERLHSFGINDMEYTYIPGLDELEFFKTWASELKLLALPHISIFRPIRAGQKHLMVARDYLYSPVGYLCEMRLFYEQQYREAVYGDQLGNLWLFPIDRVNPVLRKKHGTVMTESGYVSLDRETK